MAVGYINIDSLTKLNNFLNARKARGEKNQIDLKKGSVVKRRVFKALQFHDFTLSGHFVNCKFIDCSFKNVFGFFFYLKNCTFQNCDFSNSRFSHFENLLPDGGWENVVFKRSAFNNVRFDEGDMYDTYFDDCTLISLSFSLEDSLNVTFFKCNIDQSFFYYTTSFNETDIYDEEFFDLLFQDCKIEHSLFIGGDLRKSAFVNTSIYKAGFVDCKLSNGTIIETRLSKYPNYVSIDFQSILKSDDLDINILKTYFNIHSFDVKKIAASITTEINFKSLFISYSFKDKLFAQLLNDELSKSGLKTFLWAKDAPGGQLLEDIMVNNIKKHDKILFIASEHSIKSKACQFEMTEARKKQEATWANDTFFVLHLDNYLFEVTKNKIRPIAKAEEFWENILELRRVNSRDFSIFNTSEIDKAKFSEAIRQIIAELNA